MNIINVIKNIFKRNQEYNLVNNYDVSLIPKREMFKDNQDIINLIDNYKKLYMSILKKRIFTSIDLKLDDSINQMNMNIHLILNQCLNDKNKYNIYENVENKLKDFVIETNNLTSLAKLKLYQDEIQDLELKNICKVIALDELSKDIRYNLLVNKRNSIRNELSNLVNIMTIFKSQRVAINIEIENYKKDIEVGSYNNYRHIDRKYNNKRFDNVDKYILVLPKKYQSIYNEAVLTVPEFTAIIERLLEIYVYEHKDLIEKYKNELDIIGNEEKNLENKKEYVAKIKEIEYMFNLFDLYGYNLVNDNDFEKLYRVKFDILTIDINNLESCPFNILESKELEVYKNIISEKLNEIYNAKAIEILVLMQYNYLKKIIKILDNLFKTGKYFDYDKILSNHMLLALVLAFNKENGLKKFFEEFKIDKYERCYYFLYRVGMDFDKKIPLITGCEVLQSFYDAKEMLSCDLVGYDLLDLNVLRKMIYNQDIKNIYKVQEGIVGIRDKKENHPFLFTIRKELYDKVKDNNCMSVVFPKTLEYIDDKVFKDIKIKELFFNEGLVSIGNNSFYNQDANRVVIPSTLKKVYLGTFNWDKIEELEFTNFKNSKVLSNLLYSDDSEYKEILKKMFKVEHKFNQKFNQKTIKGNIILRLYDDFGQGRAAWNFKRYPRDIHTQDLMLVELIRVYLINLIYEETGYKIEPIMPEKANNKVLKK